MEERLSPGLPARKPCPIDALLPQLRDTLAQHATVLLSAPPGAGKTTRVPPALLGTAWLGQGRILLLEPRRLAARAAAGFMARERGEPVGQTIGYRTRLDSRISAATRIEVITEGILTRILQSDPSLEGIGCLIFDEFHERSLQADLGLALAREIQQALRPDLRIVVMSATLAVDALLPRLNQPPLLEAEGRSFPVTLHYHPPPRERRLLDHVASSVLMVLEQEQGSILVFLPGSGEIRRVARALAGRLPPAVNLCPLYGQMGPDDQDAAIAPCPPGQRKVVLATAIAESSLTIDGIRVVIDAGLQRSSRFDPNAGMPRLVTTPASRAAADQRAGRAGRLEPGLCYRLWPEGEQTRRPAHTPPEIAQADLAALVLELAGWGTADPQALCWLDPPPPAHWNQAMDLLLKLGAVDVSGRITAHGRALLQLGLHPRLGQLLLGGRARGQARLAAELAALLSDRDPLPPGSGCDLAVRIAALRRGHPGVPPARVKPLRQLADRLSITGSVKAAGGEAGGDCIGALLALAFPDRIAQARGGRGRFRLSNGRGAFLPEEDALAGEPWLVAAELDGQAREARIFLAAPISQATLEAVLAAGIQIEECAEWDAGRGRMLARRRRLLGALVLEETELAQPPAAVLEAGLLAAVRQRGLEALPWTDAARQWQARIQLLHRLWPSDWPAVDDASLLATLEQWLGPFLYGARSWREVERVDLLSAIGSLVAPARRAAVERLAPASLNIPTGRTVRLDYQAEGGPVLATKLQSVFGWTTTPSVADGRVPVVLHLLSPAGRPLAVTADLASFWTNAYPEVRKDMRGRYPKHPWPEDPRSAAAMDGVKRRKP